MQIHLANTDVIFARSNPAAFTNTVQSLARINLEKEPAEAFCQIVTSWYGHAPLRNHIAHSTWSNADRVGALKPNHVRTNGGKAKWPGAEDGALSFTASEVEAAAYDLHLINERLKKFTHESGLHEVVTELLGAPRPVD